jgi:PPP family 3-phenylpropionic acid transporter
MQQPIVIALVWFFCLGGLGAFLPFFSLYLRENAGLTGTQVGMVLAMLPLLGIAAQPFWGQVADRSGSRTRVLVLIALGAALGYTALYLARGFTALLLLTAGLAAFSQALIPSCVAVTLALARHAGPHAFGYARVWGTVGFLVVVVSFPLALHAVQRAHGLEASAGISEPGLELMFPVSGAMLLIGAVLALALPREGAVALRAPRGDWRRLLRHGPYVRILVFTLLAYGLLHGPMTMFPVFVRARGGSLDAVSHMWILMLALEIPLIALSGASLARLGPRGLLAMGILAGGLRWTVCGLAPTLGWIYPVQILHGVIVAGFIVGAPLYVEAVVPERLRSTGQAVLAMAGVSAGGISSNLATGWLIEHVSADAPYVAGGVGALALGCLVPLFLPRPRRPTPAEGEEARAGD